MFAEGRRHGGTLDKDPLKSEMLALRIVLLTLLNSEQASGGSSGCHAKPYRRVQVDGLETPALCLSRGVCKFLRAPSEMAHYYPVLFAVPPEVKNPRKWQSYLNGCSFCGNMLHDDWKYQLTTRQITWEATLIILLLWWLQIRAFHICR